MNNLEDMCKAFIKMGQSESSTGPGYLLSCWYWLCNVYIDLHCHGRHQQAHSDSYLYLCVNSHFQCFQDTSFQVSMTQVTHLYSLYRYESVNDML